jgi:integrase
MKSSFRITKRSVDAVSLDRDAWHWDAEVPGFGLRVRNGRRVFWFKYGSGRRGKARWKRIGEYGEPWTPDEFGPTTLTADRARGRALELRGLVVAGGDPAADAATARKTPTLGEFWPTYLKAIENRKKPATIAKDEHNAERTLLPALRNRRLDQVLPHEIEALHLRLGATPVRANRCLALLSHVFTMARRLGALPGEHANPCRDVQGYAEPPRERRLTDAELSRAGESIALAEEEGAKSTKDRVPGAPHASSTAIAAIRSIIFTGARPGEIAMLRRSEVDLGRARIIKVDWKTRGKTRMPVTRVIPLPHPAVAILAIQLREISEGADYVFPGRRGSPHITVFGLNGVWERIRRHAKLEDVRLSDIGRHNFASVGVDDGFSLETIGKLLGHAQPRTTQRYAHMAPNPAQRAADAIAGKIETALARRRG